MVLWISWWENVNGVFALTLSPSGTKNIEIGVDSDGFIYLGYVSDEMNDESAFIWSKNYGEAISTGRAQVETKKDRWDCSWGNLNRL